MPPPECQQLAAGTCQEQMLQMLQNNVTQLPAAAPALPTIAMGNSSLHLLSPSRNDVDPKACRGYLNHCTPYFGVLAYQFVSDRAKIAFTISLLSDEAHV